ncbi:MAG: excinuclease ABC subunit UvrC [Candidatus Thorarchaeota archaeon]|nr:excinuclease ABC subunit UvrC [Candidatus Thorarchaeota archaeon]
MAELRRLVDDLPLQPGVYLWKDREGKVLYVGKAKELRKRVQSYMRRRGLDRKTWELMQRAEDLETIVTNTEREALLLEMTLIKKHQPKYNISLKDDRRHAWIRIDTTSPIPTVEVTRDVSKDGARYFGPYGSTKRLDRFLETLRKFLPVAICKRPESVKRECMDFHIQRCMGPCRDDVDKHEYRKLIEQLCLFLEGNEALLADVIRREMAAASESLQFERAALLRDRLMDLEIMMRRQQVIDTDGHNRDVIGISRTETSSLIQVMVIRGGMLIGTDHFLFEETLETSDEDLVTAFVEQFYFELPQLPDEILLPTPIPTQTQLASWLSEGCSTPVTIRPPSDTREQELVRMANNNAMRSLRKILILGESEDEIVDNGVKDLKEVLGLSHVPMHIECFDIANIQGTDPTGSCVVFRNGQPDNKKYRMFRVRVKETPDDYAMMREVVFRRYKGVLERGEPLPDLVIVDGGKGQLSVAQSALSELGLDYLPVAGLAKREETIFTSDSPEGITLARDSDALRLLQRIRDEAHRFAQKYHHRLREKHFTGSLLEDAPGIGPKRRKALIEVFGTIEGVRQATVAQLAQVEGMTEKAATELRTWLDSRKGQVDNNESTET